MQGKETPPETPVVMCFSHHDPSGASGIQADIESLFSIGCHCAPITSAILARDTQGAKDIEVLPCSILIEQARAVFEDMPVAAIKIGFLGNSTNVEAVHTLLRDYPEIPAVLDPFCVSSNMEEAQSDKLYQAISALLLPDVMLTTANTEEVKALAPCGDTPAACADMLLDEECQYLLLTGTHSKSDEVINTLYCRGNEYHHFNWPRLKQDYIGAGCTLAACCAGYLAQQFGIFDAVSQAQEFTWQSLKYGRRLGMGQWLPNRLFWTQQDTQRITKIN